jgi:hypothetical protein
MIDKLIHDDEKSRRDFDAYIEVWEKSADIKDFDKIDTLADWQKVRSRIGFKTISRRLPFRSYLVRIAAVLILAAGSPIYYQGLLEILLPTRCIIMNQ